MPKFVVTPDDREWFGRCRRAWDLGARARRGLVPHAAPLEPDGSLVVALRAALAVHYFPGMWAWDRTIVEPLVPVDCTAPVTPSTDNRLLVSVVAPKLMMAVLPTVVFWKLMVSLPAL